jgi:hypothetical protein
MNAENVISAKPERNNQTEWILFRRAAQSFPALSRRRPLRHKC